MNKSKIKKLIIEYGNAMFDCGAEDSGNIIEYKKIQSIAQEKKQSLIEEIFKE